jgi:DNA (cytosine-5)-methyltransferase 1
MNRGQRGENMGAKPTVVDLFSGAGGMSTGFEMAGYEVMMGIEYIQHFSDTFSINHPNSITICNDIREVSCDEILEKLEGKEIDVVIGGPPCQGFSGAGRRDVKDPRNSLFMDFVRVVGAIKPKYFVMENVPGILNMKNEEGQKVIEIIRQEFNNIGYYVEWKKLLAADYGVPQKRRRVIFIGCPLDSDGKRPSIPVNYPHPTHVEKIPDKNALDVGNPSLQQWVGAGTVLLSKEDAPAKSFHTQKMIDGFRRRKERNKARGRGFGWQIIKPEKPCYTISARYWKDGSDALVQYSDNEVRMLTQGEAAAIQTFPKDYEFCGNKKEVWMQIGNAVPCLLAKAIAESLLTHL